MDKKNIVKKSLNYSIYIIVIAFAIFYLYKTIPKKGPAYYFQTTNIRNEKVNLEEYKGRVILLDFWGVWCPPCRKMLPKLVELNSEYKSKGVSIIGVHVVSGFRGNEFTQKFSKNYKLNYPIWTSTREIEQRYQIKSYPTMIIIDKKGQIREVIVGTQSERKVKKIFDKLLKE
jgi:thiol-disulfide isomerase/thioredoxin